MALWAPWGAPGPTSPGSPSWPGHPQRRFGTTADSDCPGLVLLPQQTGLPELACSVLSPLPTGHGAGTQECRAEGMTRLWLEGPVQPGSPCSPPVTTLGRVGPGRNEARDGPMERRLPRKPASPGCLLSPPTCRHRPGLGDKQRSKQTKVPALSELTSSRGRQTITCNASGSDRPREQGERCCSLCPQFFGAPPTNSGG